MSYCHGILANVILSHLSVKTAWILSDKNLGFVWWIFYKQSGPPSPASVRIRFSWLHVTLFCRKWTNGMTSISVKRKRLWWRLIKDTKNITWMSAGGNLFYRSVHYQCLLFYSTLFYSFLLIFISYKLPRSYSVPWC